MLFPKGCFRGCAIQPSSSGSARVLVQISGRGRSDHMLMYLRMSEHLKREHGACGPCGHRLHVRKFRTAVVTTQNHGETRNPGTKDKHTSIRVHKALAPCELPLGPHHVLLNGSRRNVHTNIICGTVIRTFSASTSYPGGQTSGTISAICRSCGTEIGSTEAWIRSLDRSVDAVAQDKSSVTSPGGRMSKLIITTATIRWLRQGTG